MNAQSQTRILIHIPQQDDQHSLLFLMGVPSPLERRGGGCEFRSQLQTTLQQRGMEVRRAGLGKQYGIDASIPRYG